VNVQDICELLAELRQEEIDRFFGGQAVPYEDLFPEADTPEFAQETNDRYIQLLSQLDSDIGSHIGVKEANAFITSVQKAHGMRSRSRVAKWATVYDSVDKASEDVGTLKAQLASIGVKIDEEFITKQE